MAPDKSLAAGIEAVLRSQIILRRMGPDSFVEGFSEAAEEVAAYVAALQSRAFEDGAPSLVAKQAVAEMRRRYEHFDQQAALADCRDYQLGYHSGIRAALQAVGLWDAALPLQPEGERSDG
ncbi:hypothetical protein [Methylorubrum sp. DB1722]|uniref:hypothetical protein n=1 Tax=Methylorubrum sp. DB1722 TaxID=2478916 RepID=UPI0018E3C841|nr:hypothetical protein [Methylorubrum sp. DB1722]MBI1690477.1 hypothetical protein [Methylorubrum sp. DB1722]